jgi:hypothetical protein
VEYVKSVYRGDKYKIVNRLMRMKRERLTTSHAASTKPAVDAIN